MSLSAVRNVGIKYMTQLFLLSCRLWIHTSNAIVQGNQCAATNEKYLLEEEQRKAARERKAKMEDWNPRYFERNLINGEWIYKYAEWAFYSFLHHFI